MHQVDPMVDKYSSLTPYNYAFNDPVAFNDPSGADPWEVKHHPNKHKVIDYSGTASVAPGSGNNWADQYRDVAGNMMLMSTNTFRDFYGLDDGYGGTNYERAGQLANYLAAMGSAGVTRYSIGINGQGDGNGNIIPGTEVYHLYIDQQGANGGFTLAQDGYTFRILHSAKDSFTWDWFIETQRDGNLNSIETAVLIIYNDNSKDVGTEKYGKVVQIIKATRFVYSDADGFHAREMPYNPSLNMNEWIDAAIQYHAAPSPKNVFEKIIDFMFTPSKSPWPNPFDPNPPKKQSFPVGPPRN